MRRKMASTIRGLRPLVVLCSLAYLLVNPGCSKDETPTNPQPGSLQEEIDQIASEYVRVGAVFGIIDRQHNKLFFSYGTKATSSAEPPDANTVFEIGSITKTFTCILMADMFLKGSLSDDTVGHYLPADKVSMPSREGVQIRFFHLATHSSGIPRRPQEANYPYPPGYQPSDPYAVYTTEHVYDCLTNYCQLEFTPGTYWLYSNMGMGLAGHVVGLVDGTSYEQVLTREIFDVLAMGNSSLFLTDQQRSNLAVGHNSTLTMVPNWTAQDIFQGAGFIKSSANDMLKYMEANLGLVQSPLKPAMDLSHQPQFHQGSLGEMGLGWFIQELDDGQVVTYHGGGTGGYDSYLGFNKAASTGSVLLFNSKVNESVYVIGERVLKAVGKHP